MASKYISRNNYGSYEVTEKDIDNFLEIAFKNEPYFYFKKNFERLLVDYVKRKKPNDNILRYMINLLPGKYKNCLDNLNLEHDASSLDILKLGGADIYLDDLSFEVPSLVYDLKSKKIECDINRKSEVHYNLIYKAYVNKPITVSCYLNDGSDFHLASRSSKIKIIDRTFFKLTFLISSIKSATICKPVPPQSRIIRE